MGFVGRCVWKFTEEEGGSAVVVAGVQGYVNDPATEAEGFLSRTLGSSNVYVDQTNVFEYEAHQNTENMVIRFWDDGREMMPLIMWVTHDADTDRTEQTANAHQAFGQFVWMSTQEAVTYSTLLQLILLRKI